MDQRPIRSALISVYYKDGLDSLVQLLDQLGVSIYSTGGTQDFIQKLGIPVTPVESLTGYPSILGGRVKTLHPTIFGGILNRRSLDQDQKDCAQYDIPPIDLVIVDLYPFEETVTSGAPEHDIIEKIDIGGISLIRAAAKNFRDVTILASKSQYGRLENILRKSEGKINLAERKRFAMEAFQVSSHYDSAIYSYFAKDEESPAFKQSIQASTPLRYGENPHQKGLFYGDLDALFEKLNGKELSYNNLLDVDNALALIDDLPATSCAIIKHNNACGCATGATLKEAYLRALASDPVSAFGGVIITNATITKDAALELHQLFFEILIAPAFEPEALDLLKEKKNRILLQRKALAFPAMQFRTLLNGVLVQDKDLKREAATDLKVVTKRAPSEEETKAMLFANILVKHTKSNAIILATADRMITSGVGQTSRVDALKQAIEKAKSFNLPLEGAVMASDAFFPFNDCVEIAHQAGIAAVIQPGGSVRDQDSIDFCDQHNMAMVVTGFRHFKH